MVAVEHPALRDYKNVIVFPKVGRRSPASFLGGGETSLRYRIPVYLRVAQGTMMETLSLLSGSRSYVALKTINTPAEPTLPYCRS